MLKILHLKFSTAMYALDHPSFSDATPKANPVSKANTSSYTTTVRNLMGA
jgi:hypothetical protein